VDDGCEILLREPDDEGTAVWPRVLTGRAPRVLVVDDEEDFLELTEMFLSADGFEVHTAKSASEALWSALKDPPDLVFLDLMLPGANGFQVLGALRAEPETRDVPVFACSALDIRDAERVLAAGFDGHFPKPVNWPGLRNVLRGLFSR
jgi:CheY-like chemotaxis protein